MADFKLFARRIKLFLATLTISGGFALLFLNAFNFIHLETASYLPLGLSASGLIFAGYIWLVLEFDEMLEAR